VGNEYSGRGGIGRVKFRAAQRMLDDGTSPPEVARAVGIDRKTAHQIDAGEHIYQTDPRWTKCQHCGAALEGEHCRSCHGARPKLTHGTRHINEIVAAYAPRQETAELHLEELTKSVTSLGVIQSVLIDQEDGRLLDGERRLAAAKAAGVKRIPTVEIDAPPARMWDCVVASEFAREDRNPIERALLLAEAMEETNHTQSSLAEIAGRPQSQISEYLAMLRLPDIWRDFLIDQTITAKHARHLTPFAGDAEVMQRVLAEFDAQAVPPARDFGRQVRDIAAEVQAARPDDEPATLPLRRPPKRAPMVQVKLKFPSDVAPIVEEKLELVSDALDAGSREAAVILLIEKFTGEPLIENSYQEIDELTGKAA